MATFADTDVKVAAREFAAALKAQGLGGGLGTGMRAESSSKSTQKDQQEVIEENIRAVRESNKEFDELKDTVKKTAKSMLKNLVHDFGGTVDRAANALLNFRGLDIMANDIKSSLAEGVEAGTLWQRQQDIMTKGLGISVTQLNQFDKASRQAQIAMGGYSEWVQELGDRSEMLYMRFGNFEESNKFATMALERMVHSGITPTLDNLEKVGDVTGRYGQSLFMTMDRLQKLGVTYQESSEILEDITKDENVRAKLRAAATEEEREQIIRGKLARFEEFKALGMTTERAIEASKALDEVGGRKALDRFKQAAKAQAALSAMGIEGSGRAAEIIRKGQRATAEEQAELARIMGTAKDRLDEAAMGTFGEEVTMQALYDKGLAPLNLNLENFTTKLDENAAVTDEKLGELTSITKEGNAYEQTMAQWAGINRDLAKNALENSALVNMSIGVLDKILAAVGMIAPAIITALGLRGGLGAVKGSIGKMGNIFKGSFKGLKGVLKGLGGAGLVAGAGAIGWEIGTAFYERYKGDPTFQNITDTASSWLDKGLSFFSEDAKYRLELRKKMEKQEAEDEANKRRAKASEDADKRQKKTSDEATKQTANTAEAVKEAKRNADAAMQALDVNKSQKDILAEIRNGIMSINEAVGGEPIDIEWRPPATAGL